ncbi:MAG: sulfurtransferase [Burkholderiales bacterium]|nr:sulfurtransferase [Burkholderiales bacterium]MCA3226751.1 sulfurtransferase [Burkholderiales bacterium]
MYRTLVTVEALEDNLFNALWCVVDCRHDLMDFAAGFAAYQAGHIPNATFAHIEEDLSGEKTPAAGRHPLPRREDLAAIFEEWGIGNDTQIVAYDAQGGQFASRLWWLARWLGHEAVAVLDGGWQAWLARTQWSSTEDADRVPGSFRAGTPLVQTVDTPTVLACSGAADTVLVDARAAERFEGRVEPIDPVAGHVPGACNRFWQSNLVEPNGRFKPAAQLRAEYEALLAGRAPLQMIQMCGSGISAAHNLLAMEHAGLFGARLYAGSWSEWIRDPARPVATGP